MTRRRVIILIAVSWLMSISLEGLKWEKHFRASIEPWYLLWSIAVLYIIVAICTYSVIIWRLRKRRMKRREMISVRNAIENNKQYLVPGLIILTFILLYLIPYPLQRTYFKSLSPKQNDMKETICELLTQLGLIVDPIIFVLFTKHYRESLVKVIVKRKQRREVAPNVAVVHMV